MLDSARLNSHSNPSSFGERSTAKKLFDKLFHLFTGKEPLFVNSMGKTLMDAKNHLLPQCCKIIRVLQDANASEDGFSTSSTAVFIDFF